MSEAILVVDDEKEIADLVEVYLQNDNFHVYKCYTGTDALRIIGTETLDLVILDVMLPDMSGFDILKHIRKSHTYPVIMLTAKETEMDRVNGLTLGADDYITKPFYPLELMARVKAQLRRCTRYNAGTPPEEILIHKGLTLNTQTHECTLNEKPLTLTPTEFTILKLLCQEKGNVVSSDQLFHAIWGSEYYNKNNNTITVHIRHLREKMGDSFDSPKYIKTVWGVGYKIEA